jgi:hypothetical protein
MTHLNSTFHLLLTQWHISTPHFTYWSPNDTPQPYVQLLISSNKPVRISNVACSTKFKASGNLTLSVTALHLICHLMPNTWCFEWSQKLRIKFQVVQTRFWDFMDLTMQQPHSFEKSLTTNTATQHNTPEHLHLQQNCCKTSNLTTQFLYSL